MGLMFLGAVLFFSVTRLMFLCQYFQQEEYDGRRFLDLVFGGKRLIDKQFSLVLLFLFAVSFVFHSHFLFDIFLIVLFLMFGLQHKRFEKKSKKPLVITSRVKRILLSAIVIAFGFYYMTAPLFGTSTSLLFNLLYIQLLSIFLVLGNLVLMPYEIWVQRRFYNEAVAKLKELNPTIIGITGSYGKTSVKHILSHVLGQATPTLATPGSVNTVMGITRIIRERLKPEHRYFIAEMGAYGIGSIKRLCDFCPPSHGILTAVGQAHYERFRTQDNVAQAKFELWNAVQEKQGSFIINGDQVEDVYIKKYAGQNNQNVSIVSSKDPSVDFFIKGYEFDEHGLIMTLVHDGKEHMIKAPLYGVHQVWNIALVFALTRRLGVPAKTILAALKTTPQIKHRLEVKQYKDGPDVIDDAYNANPSGFSSALEVLDILGKASGGKRVLVTPGMVELGDLHTEKHTELGTKAAAICDTVLLVRSDRFPSFEKAVLDHKGNRKVHIRKFDSFIEAKRWLDKHIKVQDVILYENDLPDLYESKVSL